MKDKIKIYSCFFTLLVGLMLTPCSHATITEIQVNTYTTSSQDDPSVAIDANGNFVIAWESYNQDGDVYGVYAQRYDSSGNPLGSEFKVNTYTTSNQRGSSVAMDANGNFVIVWQSDGQDGSLNGIYAQRYDSSGNPLGSEFKVNTYTTSDQEYPTVAMDASGNFVIAWQSDGQDGSLNGIYAQRYDSFGSLLGSEFRVNTYTTNNQANPSVAMDPNGNFVIAWNSLGQVSTLWSVYAQRYDSSGNPLGSEFRVNTYYSNSTSQESPSVAMDANGNFVIAWKSYGQDGSLYGIYAQRYNSTGSPLGSEFRVNTYTTASQVYPSVAMDANGNFLIAWWSYDQDGSGIGIYAQRYDSFGSPVGSEFRVNTYTTNDQSSSSVAMDPKGNFVIAWQSNMQDEDGWGIFMKYYRSGKKRAGLVDFDGDGKTDIAVYRGSTGAWYVIPSGGELPYIVGWGGLGFKPVSGDYDGDTKTDIAIYDTTGGAWWIIPSSSAPSYGVGWGGSGFKPVPGDYDGDGKTDIAIYDITGGAWWILPSSAATVADPYNGAYGIGWGGSAFKPVPGDYDGDGKTDVAIYNTANGGWWIVPSSGTGPQGQAGAYGVGWGGNGFTPVPGDYDGDGKTDVAIYQSSNGGWWIIYSSDGSTHGVGWGGDVSDVPLTTNPD